MHIGPYKLDNPLVLAPMAGISDFPFRQLCRNMGAAMTVSEMLTAETDLWHTYKSRQRCVQASEQSPHAIQIAGSNPEKMGDAARQCADQGAQIIDINMGCPAKKVCNVLAGSALLKNEKLVSAILQAVVRAVPIPVTLKIRTGWDRNNKNALKIAHIAEDCGIQALTIHGRTRADRFSGRAEYQTIRQVKQQIRIPVFANGDIDNPAKAKAVLEYTQADGLYIGRASRGNPWLFREINYFLTTGKNLPLPSMSQKQQTILQHLRAIYRFYGEQHGIRIARKHLSWYLKTDFPLFWQKLCRIESAKKQYNQTEKYLNEKKDGDTSKCILNQNRVAA